MAPHPIVLERAFGIQVAKGPAHEFIDFGERLTGLHEVDEATMDLDHPLRSSRCTRDVLVL